MTMSGLTREVVTLQIGHFSNFVGTHWWNVQEASFVYSPQEMCGPKEINHDVLFREGKNLMGDVTYTPRLVVVDLKGSLNTLKQDGVLYEIPMLEEDLGWQSDVNLHKHESAAKNEFLQDLEESEYPDHSGGKDPELCRVRITIGEDAGDDFAVHMESDDYIPGREEPESDKDESSPQSKEDELGQVFGQKKFYDLDDSVTVWSDFLRTHFHPRSIHTLEDYQHNNELQKFDLFGLGRQVFRNDRDKMGLEDRLHFFMEDCDCFQGIHLLVDTQDGFGGLGASILEQIQDDYAAKGLFVFGLSPPAEENMTIVNRCYQLLNTVMSYNALSSLSSAFVPLATATSLGRHPSPSVSFPHLQYKPSMWYHSSAILGASLDTMSMPYRLQTSPSFMTHMIDAMTVGSRKVLGLQTCFPFPLKEDGSLTSSFMGFSTELPWQPITPLFSSQFPPFAQSVVLRGIPLEKIKGPRELVASKTAENILQSYLRDSCSASLSASWVLQQGCNVTAPFPHIFSPKITTQGDLSMMERLPRYGVGAVPLMTSLQASAASGKLLSHLVSEVGHLKIKKFIRFLEAGVEEDEYNETVSSLQTLAQGYTSSSEAFI